MKKLLFYIIFGIRVIPVLAYLVVEANIIVLTALKNVFLSLDEGFAGLIKGICDIKVKPINKRNPEIDDICIGCNNIYEKREEEESIKINLN